MNLSVETLLMIVLVVCALYYLMNKCACKEGMTDSGGPWPNCPKPSVHDSPYEQMKKCYQNMNPRCKFKLGNIENTCEPESQNDIKCSVPTREGDDWGLEGWKRLSLAEQKDICENVYPNSSNRNLKCKLDKSFLGNTCVKS